MSTIHSDWSEGLDDWPRLPSLPELKAAASALVIVDMQYSDAHGEYGIGKMIKGRWPVHWRYYSDRLAKMVMPNTLSLLAFFRSRRLPVMFTNRGSAVTSFADLRPAVAPGSKPDGQHNRITFHAGEFEHQLLPELGRRPDELIIHKTSSGAFNSTGFDQWLRNMRIETLVVTGVATNACVELTARDAADRGYNTILVEDACATFDEESHQATMRTFARVCGRVWSTSEVLDRFAKQLSEA